MSYAIHSLFYSLQGEGANTGRPAVFIRFAGCNLWSGREADRATAVCRFCDTDFATTDAPRGGRYDTAATLARAARALHGQATPCGVPLPSLRTGENRANHATPSGAPRERPRAETDNRRMGSKTLLLVVCTGGEPALQLDAALVEALHGEGFEIAIETNGTLPLAPGIDWICVSPKVGVDSTPNLVVRSGDELKLIFPPPGGLDPESLVGLEFRHFFLQPRDDGTPASRERHTRLAVEYCLRHPRWRLSLQTHKLLGIP